MGIRIDDKLKLEDGRMVIVYNILKKNKKSAVIGYYLWDITKKTAFTINADNLEEMIRENISEKERIKKSMRMVG